MAILSNLVVHGASRFLNTAYFNDVSILGTASLASLSLSGTLAVTGAATLSGALNVSGTTSLAGLNVSGTATFSKTTDLAGTANNGPALIVGGAVGSAHLEIDANEIQAKASGTTTTTLYMNYDGGAVYLSGNQIYANGTTFVAPTTNVVTLNSTNVNVSNNLHATHFDLQTVAQLGGSFYVSPTLKFPNSGTKLAVSKSSTALTLTIKDSSISTSTMAGIAWTVNSAVKVSGTINGVVTGTMDGTITGITNGSQMVVQVSGGNWNSVAATSTDLTASQFSDLTVMVYQRRVVDGSTNNDYRVGIWMNCYDIANSSATIRVYGGTSSAPNVLLGNLTNAGLGTVNGITPSGWGLYAQNAFLWGSIVSTEGQIGGWTIGDTKLYNGTDSLTSTTPGTYIGAGTSAATSGIRNYKDANTFVNITGGVITAKAVDLTGKITATSGKIGKYNITTSYLDTYQDSSNPTAATNAGFGGNQAFWAGNTNSNSAPFRVSYGGALVATSATITGAITATSGTIGASNATNKITIGTDSTNASIYYGMSTLANTSSNGFYIGTDGIALGKGVFKVTNAGALTATSATITGAITATSGTIGASNASQKITIGTNTSYASIYYGMSSLANTSSNGFYIGTDGIALGKGAFKVTAAGALTATSATITGAITATSGTIGASNATNKITIGTNTTNASIYYGMSSLSDTTNNGFYIGTDGIALGKGAFKVTNAGVLNATGATISGTLTAGANSTIGPWTVTATSIYKTNATMGNSTAGAAYFGNDGLSITDKFKVSAAGAITATSGTIAGWSIDTNSFQTGTYGTENGVILCTGTSSAKSIGGSASISGWTITSGAKFGVTKAGVVYGSDVHLTGEITATSGTIGGASITNGVLQIANANITSLDASKINSGSIATARIAAGTITADKLAANTLHIGGHNLLKSSYLQKTNSTDYNIANVYLVARDKPVAGETVTIQIKGTLAATKTSWGIYNSGGSISMTTLNSSNYDSATGIYTKTFEWKVTTGSTTAANTHISIYTLNNNQSGASSIEWVMLERGNQPSGWGLSADEVGGFNINNTSIYSGAHSAYNTAVDGVYIGSDYISLGSGGVTYFKNDGTGKVGPWTLSSTYLRNGNIASATNTTVAGVYLGTDGLNISNGTVATTSYITKSAVNIGNKLTWNGTTLSVTGNINATSGEIGKWAIGEDMLMGMSTIQIPGSTSVIKNRTYLYSGEMNYGTLTATKNADGGTMYITPTTGNVSVCAKFSTRPVHPDSAGQYSNTYWVAPSVQVTGYTGYISIKYTFDYLGGETEGGTGTIFQRENITSTSQTTVYSLIQMKNANDIIRNIDTLITFETPVANNQITVRCPIYTLSHSTIYFYEQAVEAFYGDNFTAISIQREDTNGDVSETFKIDQSGYVYASDIQLNGDITNGNGVNLNELSVRGTVQSASKSVAITSSNTIGATPAIGAQLTLTPGTYLLWGRFVFSTSGSGTTRNNRIAFYTGASPTDSTMLTESQVCVFTAGRNWGALTTTYIVSPTANTTYTVGGTSSLPGPDGGMSVIKSIRLL